jgi:hypothetical protein
MRRSIVVVVLSLLLATAVARAHVGAVPATATFSSPASPVVTQGANGPTLEPYTPSTADQSFRVAWSDGDVDPTGKFDFYYLPYQPHYQVGAAWIQQNATPLREVGQPPDTHTPARRWVACTCNADLGVTCPDAGPRPCDNELLWDTSAIQPGAYFIIAVNDDDPFLTFSPADGPVIISHGGTPPPAVVVLRPDGVGTFDKSYDTKWFAVGKPPLKFDVAYGKSGSMGEVFGPTTSLGKSIAAAALPDGTFGWTWDLTSLPGPKAYFFQVTVTDGDGRIAYTNSRYQITVYHPPPSGDLGPDAGAQAGGDLGGNGGGGNGGGGGGGGCAVPGGGSHAPYAVVVAALVAAAVGLLARRRARR